MPLDPYSSCPCGSGKKFKWCCANYFTKVEQAIDLDRNGQQELALKTLKDLTTQHGDKPAVWCYFAQFLYGAERGEAAEEALAQALKIDPKCAMAYFLRGVFRQSEGEVIGSLILFRKAAEAYDAEAHEALARVYEMIFRTELDLNRPVASRAALEQLHRHAPDEPEVKALLDGLFGSESRLPQAARKAYTLRATAKPITTDAATGRLSDAKKAYETLVAQTPDDPAAWFNLGVIRAWLGEQPQAVEALGKSLEYETDDYRAEEAGALVEVLRCAQGMENESDFAEFAAVMPIRDGNAVVQLLRNWEQTGRLYGTQVDQESGTLNSMVIEKLPSLLAVGSTTMAKIACKLMLVRGVIRVWHPNREQVRKVAGELRDQLLLAVEAPQETLHPTSFGDVALEAYIFPMSDIEIEKAEEKLVEHGRHYFEEVWIHKPLKSLGGSNPLDAVGSKLLRKRLLGVLKFVEQCYASAIPFRRADDDAAPVAAYDFAALRHKLGLEYLTAAPPEVKVIEAPKAAKRDLNAMNAAELAGQDVASLSVEELEQAMRAALKLDAKDLAVAFAQAGTLKPFDASRPDRYPLYACLIAGATAEGDPVKVIKTMDEGAAYDAANNEGKRVNDYGLRRAQYFAKSKDMERAAVEFDALIARNPSEGRFYTTAAETMLGLRNGARALGFAEKGLAKAREINNRDLEGHCQELIGAARKQG